MTDDGPTARTGRTATDERAVDALLADGLADAVDDDDIIRSQSADQRQTGRWNAGAIPMERSAKFGESVRRLFDVLGRERSRLALVVVCAVGSVVLNVLGPLILGHATDTIIDGLRQSRRHRLRRAARHAVAGRRRVPRRRRSCSCGSSWMITGLVQRTMLHLRGPGRAQDPRPPARLHRPPAARRPA